MNAIKKFFVASPQSLRSMALIPIAFATSTGLSTPIQTATDLQNLLCNIAAWFIWIVILISVIMVVFAAFTYATAEDDTEKTSKARRTLLYAAVGIAVALLAAGFPSIVATIFPNSTALPTTCL